VKGLAIGVAEDEPNSDPWRKNKKYVTQEKTTSVLLDASLSNCGRNWGAGVGRTRELGKQSE
jgi:hypothetical protein